MRVCMPQVDGMPIARVAAITVALATLVIAGNATAAPLAGDAELDPTAYVLDGHSVHVGVGAGHLRVDLGAFAMTLPAVIHGQDGFTAAFDGFGAKLQYFVRGDRTGAFAGIDAGVLRLDVGRDGTDLAARDRQVQAGVHLGYRFALPAQLYVTPWLGVGYAFGADDVTLAGATFEATRVNVFPAVHVGYRFR